MVAITNAGSAIGSQVVRTPVFATNLVGANVVGTIAV